jgi:ABC-type glycerol-3-phosphate transport system substrate-binding protein
MRRFLKAFSVFLCVFLIGCNKAPATPEYAYKSFLISSSGEDYSGIEGAVYKDGILNLLVKTESEIESEYTVIFDYYICRMDSDGQITDKTPLEHSSSDKIINYTELSLSPDGKLFTNKTTAIIDKNGNITGNEEAVFLDENFTETDVLNLNIKPDLRIENEIPSDLPNFGLYTIRPRYVFEIPNDEYIIIGKNTNGISSVYIAKEVEIADYSNREIIKIAGIMSNAELSQLAADYSEINPLVKVEYIKYLDDDLPTAMTKLNLDLLAGENIDMTVIWELSEVPYISNAKKGMYTDLLPFFLTDPDISYSDLVTSVADASLIDGKLYSIPQSFSLSTLAGRSDVFTDSEYKSFTELKRMADESGRELSSFAVRNTFVLQFIRYSIETYIDREAKSTTFNSPEFIELLKYAKSLPTEYTTENSDAQNIKKLQSDKILFSYIYINNYRSVLEAETLDWGSDITVFGYPNGKDNGIEAQLCNELAIVDSSKHKDAAWGFIKYVLTDGYIDQNPYQTSFPIVKSRLSYLRDNAGKKSYTSDTGERAENQLTITLSDGETQIKLPEITEADLSQVDEIIGNVQRVHRFDFQLDKIVNEELEIFFAGDRDAIETAKILDNRVSTYLAEIA